METDDIERRADLDVSQYQFTSSEVVPLEKVVSGTSLTSTREERVTVKNEAMHPIMKPLRSCSETEVEAFLQARKV